MSKLARPLIVGFLVAALAVYATTSAPARAYGPENWQIAANGTGVFPGTGQGFGFWGWCAFGGGVSSGNTGDCQFAQYFHGPAGSGFTCHISLDISSWSVSDTDHNFVITGDASVTPTGLTGPCLQFFPGSASFTDVDSGIPAAAGHYNLGSIGGEVGEFNMQVTQIR